MHMQVVEAWLLKGTRAQRVSRFSGRWSGPKALEALLPVAEHNLHYPSHKGHSGLGANKAGPYIAEPTIRDWREKVVEALGAECEEKHVLHASRLPLQGVWTHWKDDVCPFDLSWESLITSVPSLIKFVLNAQINSVRTPDMLKLWGFIEKSTCPLCAQEPCNLHHILVNCRYALDQKRYTWRHDSVLVNIQTALLSLLEKFNKKKPSQQLQVSKESFAACFVTAGGSKPKLSKVAREGFARSTLECANDWELLVDLGKQAQFPPTIIASPLRPDIVIWSKMARVVVLIELTCCAEEGVREAQLRKQTKYIPLVNEINATKLWKASLHTLEICARGLVATSSHKIFVTLGFTSSQARSLCKTLSRVVARRSYAIYTAHSNLSWSHGSSDLIVEEKFAKRCVGVNSEAKAVPQTLGTEEVQNLPRSPNIVVLRENGIKSLFHFTDASNISSIREHGLLAWKRIAKDKIESRMNSSALSHKLDAAKGLSDYIRLSLCRRHPMMFKALKEERISRPVILEIKLEVVSRPGVLFCERNAAASGVKTSANPNVIHFEVVKKDYVCTQRAEVFLSRRGASA